MLKKVKIKFLDLHQKWMGSILDQDPSFIQVSWKSDQ